MWAITNQTPFQVARGFARDRDGAEFWLVVIKGTFEIASDDAATIAEHQEPGALAPVYLGKPGSPASGTTRTWS